MNGSYVFIAFTGSPVSLVDLIGLPFLMLIGILAFVLNVIVLTALRRADDDVSNSFIANLAVADAFTGIIVIYNSMYTLLEWRNLSECLFRFGLLIGVNMASVLCITVLTVDRYIKIKHPFRHKRIFTSGKVMFLNSMIWIISMTLAILPVSGWHLSQEDTQICDFFTVITTGYLVTVFVIFLIPFIVIVTLYPQIFIIVLKHAKKIHNLHLRSNTVIASRSTLRFAKTVGIIIGVYLLCWAPVGTYLMLIIFARPLVEKSGIKTGVILTYTAGIGFLNSVVNPLVYAKKIPEVGKAFRRICCFCTETTFKKARFRSRSHFIKPCSSNPPSSPNVQMDVVVT